MSKFMIPCKQAAELVEQKIEHKLRPMDRIRLKLHLLICRACRLYDRQSRLIHKALNKYYDPKQSELESTNHSENLKNRISARLWPK